MDLLVNLERRETEGCLDLRELLEEREILALVVLLVLWVPLVLLVFLERKDRKVLRDHWVPKVRREIQESWDRLDHLVPPLM